MKNLHDQRYRKLFSSPHMVRALFDGILPLRLREQVDLDTLEPLPSDFISDQNRDRQGDRIWRVRRRDGDMLYLLILLEHQSQQDRLMSVRCMGYTALLYEDLAMRGRVKRRQRLPAILPLVLYSGTRRWRAPLEVSALLEPAPEGLQPYQPQMRYLVLDEGALVQQGHLPSQNLAALLFRLEHNQGLEQSREILQTVLRLTRGAEFSELRSAFSLWVRHVLLPRSLPAEINLSHVEDLSEITVMLTTHTKDWGYYLRQEGREAGLQEGRQEGASGLLEQQLSRKFGQLSPEIVARLREADTAQLEAWSLNVLDAESLDQVFRGF